MFRLQLKSLILFVGVLSGLLVGGGVLWQAQRSLFEEKQNSIRFLAQRDMSILTQKVDDKIQKLGKQLLDYTQSQENSLFESKMPEAFIGIWLFEIKKSQISLRWHNGFEKEKKKILEKIKKISVKTISNNTETFIRIDEKTLFIKPLKKSQTLVAVGFLKNRFLNISFHRNLEKRNISLINDQGEVFYSFQEKGKRRPLKSILENIEIPLNVLFPLELKEDDKSSLGKYIKKPPYNNLYFFWEYDLDKTINPLLLKLIFIFLGLILLCSLILYLCLQKSTKRLVLQEEKSSSMEKYNNNNEKWNLDRKKKKIESSMTNIVDEFEIRKRALLKMSRGIVQNLVPPTTSIIGQAKLMGARRVEDETQGNLRAIEESARKIREVLDRLSLFAGLERMETVSVNLKILIPTVLKFFELKIQDLEITLEVEDTFSGCVKAEPSLLQLVLTEIINNSLEAMARTDTSTLSVKVESKGEKVHLLIIDSGCGMSQEQLRQIKEPFSSKSVENKGMGVSVVLGVLTSFGAELNITSEIGKGTVVEVVFEIDQGKDNFVYAERGV